MKVGKLAYELDLPLVRTIHPGISIAQLEPAPDTPDPYERANNQEPPPVRAEDGEDPEYEIERLVGLQYLVKWKGYGMEHNTWYSIDDVQEAKDSINDFEELNRHLPTRNRRGTRATPIATPEQHILPDLPLPQQPRQARLTARQRDLAAAREQ